MLYWSTMQLSLRRINSAILVTGTIAPPSPLSSISISKRMTRDTRYIHTSTKGTYGRSRTARERQRIFRRIVLIYWFCRTHESENRDEERGGSGTGTGRQ
jgi:hypothetical protein